MVKTRIAPPIMYSEESEKKNLKSDYSKAGTEIDPGHENNLSASAEKAD